MANPFKSSQNQTMWVVTFRDTLECFKNKYAPSSKLYTESLSGGFEVVFQEATGQSEEQFKFVTKFESRSLKMQIQTRKGEQPSAKKSGLKWIDVLTKASGEDVDKEWNEDEDAELERRLSYRNKDQILRDAAAEVELIPPNTWKAISPFFPLIHYNASLQVPENTPSDNLGAEVVEPVDVVDLDALGSSCARVNQLKSPSPSPIPPSL